MHPSTHLEGGNDSARSLAFLVSCFFLRVHATACPRQRVSTPLLRPYYQLAAMFRPGGAGPLGRALRTRNIPGRSSIPLTRPSRTPLQPSSLALTTYKPFSTSLQRYQTGNTIDVKHEQKVGKTPLEAHPEAVSSTSSVHQVFHEKGLEEEEKGEDMLAGVKGDLVKRSPQFIGLSSYIG